MPHSVPKTPRSIRNEKKKPHHIDTSQLICKTKPLTGFYTTRATTARYFQTIYNTILKKEQIFQKETSC